MSLRSLIKDTIPLQGFRVYSIEKYYFGINIKIVPDRRYRPRCGKCNHIGIDEIARRKGHKYLTNVYDLKTRKLIWSGEGRSEKTLRQFFEYIKPEGAKRLQGICCDMWMPYVDSDRKSVV